MKAAPRPAAVEGKFLQQNVSCRFFLPSAGRLSSFVGCTSVLHRVVLSIPASESGFREGLPQWKRVRGVPSSQQEQERLASTAFPPTSTACATVSSHSQCFRHFPPLTPPPAGFRGSLLSTRTPQFRSVSRRRLRTARLYTSGTSRAVQPTRQRAALSPSRPIVTPFKVRTRTRTASFRLEPTRPNSAGTATSRQTGSRVSENRVRSGIDNSAALKGETEKWPPLTPKRGRRLAARALWPSGTCRYALLCTRRAWGARADSA